MRARRLCKRVGTTTQEDDDNRSKRRRQLLQEDDPEEDDPEADPGVIILFSTPHDVDQVLQLPAVANLVPPLQRGTTEAESLQNFKEWVDVLALTFSRSLSLVKDLDGNRTYGL